MVCVIFYHYCNITCKIWCACIQIRLQTTQSLIFYATCPETFNSSRWFASNYICSLQSLRGSTFQLLQGSYHLRVVSRFRQLKAHSRRHRVDIICRFLGGRIMANGLVSTKATLAPFFTATSPVRCSVDCDPNPRFAISPPLFHDYLFSLTTLKFLQSIRNCC